MNCLTHTRSSYRALCPSHWHILLFLMLMWLGANSHAFVPEPPKMTAKAYVLKDFQSGKIIAARDADLKRPPASLTKIMTSYVIFNEIKKGSIDFTDEVPVSEKAWRTKGSRMFIEVNSKVTVDDLIHGIIIQSGNDASVAMAEYVAGSEDAFASLMNQYAAKLGMVNTSFVNSTGMPHKKQYTTANDMAILAAAMIRDFPDLYALHAEKSFTYKDIKQFNRNKLLWRDESVDGIKTGYTKVSGYCLVSSAKRDNMRLISVVLGTDNDKARTNESQALLTYGYRFYKTHKVYSAGDVLKTTRVWKGNSEDLTLGLNKDLYITIPKGRYEAIDAAISVADDQALEAPIQKGQSYGSIKLELDGELITQQPVVALTSIDTGGLWKRFWDSVVLFFMSLFGLILE